MVSSIYSALLMVSKAGMTVRAIRAGAFSPVAMAPPMKNKARSTDTKARVQRSRQMQNAEHDVVPVANVYAG